MILEFRDALGLGEMQSGTMLNRSPRSQGSLKDGLCWLISTNRGDWGKPILNAANNLCQGFGVSVDLRSVPAGIGLSFHYVIHIVWCSAWLQRLHTQQGSSGAHMNDFSINNAPLIIVLLFKGEWQSFLNSRGGRGLCVSAKAWFTFWKVHLIPGGVAYRFQSILTLNFHCCERLGAASYRGCTYGCLTACMWLMMLNSD